MILVVVMERYWFGSVGGGVIVDRNGIGVGVMVLRVVLLVIIVMAIVMVTVVV